jgi:glycosyltransferase involved in cell wall biosynthesis
MSESSVIKIIYIHPVSGTGGALEALLRLVTELDTSKYYPKVICPELGPSYTTFKIHGIDVDVERGIKTFNHFSAGWYPIKKFYKFITSVFNIFYSAATLYKVIKREKPDIIHLSSSVLLGSAIGAKVANVPVVWHIREYIHDGYFGVRKWVLTRLIDKLSDAIISITDTDARRLKPSNKINVVYDSVNFKFFDRNISKEKFKSEFKINGQDRVIGMFGGISRIKGTIEFAKAAKEILKKQKDFKFLIFGPAEDSSLHTLRTKVKKIIKQMIFHQEYSDKVRKAVGDGFSGRIKLVGNRQDIPEIMAGLDLVVFPSTVPHSALPVIEAGAMAKPVVASNWGETAEEMVNGITGILVPAGNPDALSRGIVKILSNPDLAKNMGEEGYKRARELFDIKKNTNKVTEIYDKVFAQSYNENSSH